MACSEWWLRFLDQEQFIGTWQVPLLRNGFRLVVFSIIIMIVVLFFRQGIMGTRELPDLFRKRDRKSAERGRGEMTGGVKTILELENVTMQFGGVVAVDSLTHACGQGRDRSAHRPQRRRQDHGLQLSSPACTRPPTADVKLRGKIIAQGHPTGKMKKLYAGSHIGEYGRLVSSTPDKITEMGVARTFQNIRLFKGMTVLENVLVATSHAHEGRAFLSGLPPEPSGRKAHPSGIAGSALPAGAGRCSGRKSRLPALRQAALSGNCPGAGHGTAVCFCWTSLPQA